MVSISASSCISSKCVSRLLLPAVCSSIFGFFFFYYFGLNVFFASCKEPSKVPMSCVCLLCTLFRPFMKPPSTIPPVKRSTQTQRCGYTRAAKTNACSKTFFVLRIVHRKYPNRQISYEERKLGRKMTTYSAHVPGLHPSSDQKVLTLKRNNGTFISPPCR